MGKERTVRPEDVSHTAQAIKGKLETSIIAINEIYERSHVLSINSRIEAARVGSQGNGFKVVAEEFAQLNGEIAKVANNLDAQVRKDIMNLQAISDSMAKEVRARRLSQICISIMDVVDRNLYERSCDVRWWATDASVAAVLEHMSEDEKTYAEQRLRTILESYTVYLDIIVTDAKGAVVARGRRDLYHDKIENAGNCQWYVKARLLRSSQEYTMECVHHDIIMNHEAVLSYAAGIFSDKNTHESIGVLGVMFNWQGLVRAVMDRVRRQDLVEDISEYHIPTYIWILDETGTVLASSDGKGEGEKVCLSELQTITQSKDQGFSVSDEGKYTQIVSWGFSPGFETYRSNWYCVIRQIFENR